jgi:hypothetical protein
MGSGSSGSAKSGSSFAGPPPGVTAQ